jgi:hypothetical protein
VEKALIHYQRLTHSLEIIKQHLAAAAVSWWSKLKVLIEKRIRIKTLKEMKRIVYLMVMFQSDIVVVIVVVQP